jgi:hypothetical protein
VISAANREIGAPRFAGIVFLSMPLSAALLRLVPILPVEA